MALLFAEGFDGWNSGSDMVNAERSTNDGAAFSPANTSSNWSDGCLAGGDLSAGMRFPVTRKPVGTTIRTAFWIKTFSSAGTSTFGTTSNRPFLLLSGPVYVETRYWGLFLIGTQPNACLSVRRYDDAFGPSAQAAIGSIALGDNAWHHVEVEFTSHVSAGVVRTWVDGVADINSTGIDTNDAASGDFSTMESIHLAGSSGNAGNAGVYMDDVIVWDDDGVEFKGRLTDKHRIRTIFPDANGSVNDFTPLSGANHENVDEVMRDKDTNYNAITTTGQDMFRFNTISFAPQEIYGIYAEALVRREGLLAHTGRIKATRGGITLTGPAVIVDPTYRAERLELIRDPVTGSRWTKAKLLAGLEIGYERVS